MQGSPQDNMFRPLAANFLPRQHRDDQQQQQPPFAQGVPSTDFSTQPMIHLTNQPAQFHPQMQTRMQSPVTTHQIHSHHHHHQQQQQQQQHFTFQTPLFGAPPDPSKPRSAHFPSSTHSVVPQPPAMQPPHSLPPSAMSVAGTSSHPLSASSATMQEVLHLPRSQVGMPESGRTYLTSFEDPIAEAYIAGQTLDEPFHSIAAPGTIWPTDGTMPLDLNLMTPFPMDPNDPSSGFSTDQTGHFDSFMSNGQGNGAESDQFDSAATILDDAGFSRITEIKSKSELEGSDAARADDDHYAEGFSLAQSDNRAGSISAGSTSAAGSKEGVLPRRRTRRRQNVSCDQCRASKRGCDFQLRLDAEGNDLSSGAGGDDDEAAAINVGEKRKMSDAGQESIAGSAGNKLVCSNCQRRGVECTTNFADSVRESKQSSQTTQNEAGPQGGKKRAITDDSSENGMRSRSVPSDGSSPDSQNQEAQEKLLKVFQDRDESQMLATTGQNVRFAQRADSLLLTTNRMRLYVHTVEPNANLWLSRACSPLRTDGDLGAYIKSAIGMDALDLSQRLWASWHVDAPSARREHQPNLFYLVYGLDHLGGEMGVWGEKPQQTTSASASQPRGAGSAHDTTSQFSDIFSDIMGMGPGGWRRSKRDLMIDEAVKATMLAYACQFRLDDEMTSSSADVASRKASDGNNYRDAHDRIATAAWKRARSLILQLAPRRSCRIAYGLFLFGVTSPPSGALTEGGSRSGADAAEDAAFALETASRHLEWFVKRCRDLVLTVEKASVNPLLSANPQVKQQRRIATDLMGLAESLGWFGLLIDTVTHVSQGRRSSMREDNLVHQSSGIGSGTDPGVKHGPVPSPGSDGGAPDRTAEALFALQDTLNLLPSRQAPPGAFPGTSETYMHEDPDDNGTFPADTEMSRRIMERAACARDLIPALLRNPGAFANDIPFDVLISANDPDAPSSSIININNRGGGLNEQVVLLGVAWGTAVEVYIWRRIGVLHTATEALLKTTDPIQALIAGKGSMVSEKIEKKVMNVIEAIRLFHNIFDHLIARALDEFLHLSRQGRTMLSFFVIHIHLGVLHFVQLAKRIEQKELELIQAFNAQSGSAKSTPSSTAGVSFSPMAMSSPTQPVSTSPTAAGSSGSPPSVAPLRSNLSLSSVERRLIGKSAALGMARMASLINSESSSLEAATRNGRHSPKPTARDGKARKGPLYAPPQHASDYTPIEDSANAPWRHPYPAMVADVLKLSSQQLHDEIWDQLIAVPRDEAELKLLMDNFNVLLEGFARTLHAVPGLGSYKKVLGDLENARDTAMFVASQGG